MCGIAGIWNCNINLDDTASSIKRMTNALLHRGPDGGNIFVHKDISLGHRRLSIISPDESSNQPMVRNNLMIVYNGELYNYKEERRRLLEKGLSFFTQSDTEVILALYEDEGIDFLKRLNGIFSFALYDKSQKTLICVRDHFGIKPFFYARYKDGIVFASELKSILSSGLVSKNINHRAVNSLLLKGSIEQPMTMLDDVESLMPGHFIICKDKTIKIQKYYTPSPANISFMDDTSWKQAIHNSFKNSVMEQLVSDVPLGAFLSGGVDSGLITAIMAKHAHHAKTFSVGFERQKNSDQYDETSDAEIIANHIGTDHTCFTIADSDVKNDLKHIVRALDHPTIDGINSYYVSKVTSSHVRVALSGTGADEIFGGYKWFFDMQAFYNAGFLQKIKNKIKYRSGFDYYNSLHSVFSKPFIESLLVKSDKDDISHHFLLQSNDFSEDISGTSKMVMETFLRNQLLPDIDTASMAHGLEVRVPFLSKELVEMALALPDHLKTGKPDLNAICGSYKREGTKAILLDIAKDYLPADIATRPKRGFLLPMARWMNTVWAEELQDCISIETLKKRDIFNEQTVINLLKEKSGLPWTQKWLIMALELWCQNILDESHSI